MTTMNRPALVDLHPRIQRWMVLHVWMALALIFWIHSQSFAQVPSPHRMKADDQTTVLKLDGQGNLILKGAVQEEAGPLSKDEGKEYWSLMQGGALSTLLEIKERASGAPLGHLKLLGAFHPTSDTLATSRAHLTLHGAGDAALAVFDKAGNLGLKGRIYENVANVEAFRPEAGAVQFAFPRLDAEETTGGQTLTIPIARTGENKGTISVRYRTVAGSATPGEDYEPTSGTLTFTDGQALAGFTLRILQNAPPEGTERLALDLYDPQGGGRLGAVSRAEVIIHELPPDPAQVAPAVEPTAVTDFYEANKFLFDPGLNAPRIQTGVSSATITAEGIAVVRGRVLGKDGATTAPLAGVTVSVLDRPEFGQTLSRADGCFDLAVSGGGALVLKLEKAGFLKAQRSVSPAPRAFTHLADVALVRPSLDFQYIDLLNNGKLTSYRIAAGSDADGTRAGRLMIRPGTRGELVWAAREDGSTSTVPIHAFNLFATEYTLADMDGLAMPAMLDPQVAYTYCVDFGVLEAIAAGAPMLNLSQPAIYYLDNFIGFPVGMTVPVGAYFAETMKPMSADEPTTRTAGRWIAEANGRVIKILSVDAATSPALAVLDVNGAGQPATPVELATFGISEDERAELARVYAPGAELWRMPLAHFTAPRDFNWPWSWFGAPPINQEPYSMLDIGWLGGLSIGDLFWNQLFNMLGWGTIDSVRQTFHESIAIPGTPWSLNYASERARGFRQAGDLTVPLLASTVPPDLVKITVEIEIAGRIFKQEFLPPFAPGLQWTFDWDGRDAYGRELNGYQTAKVRVGYDYPVYYGYTRMSFEELQSRYNYLFGLPFDPQYFDPVLYPNATGLFRRGHETRTAWKESKVTLPPANKPAMSWYSEGQSVGGWTLAAHHGYDPAQKTLYLGSGESCSADPRHLMVLDRFFHIGETVFAGMDVGPNGELYVPLRDYRQVFCLHNPTSGSDAGLQATIFAGDGESNPTVTGVSARGTSLVDPIDVSAAPDGSVYILSYTPLPHGMSDYCVYKVDPRGILTLAAGGGPCLIDTYDYYDQSYDGLDARLINFDASLKRITAGADGSLYLLQWSGRIFRVDSSGRCYLYAGMQDPYGQYPGPYVQDNVPATLAEVAAFDLDAAPDGSLYFIETDRIRKIDPSGMVYTVAGRVFDGPDLSYDDAGPATETRITMGRLLEVAPDGAIVFMQELDLNGHRASLMLRRVTPEGMLYTIGGNGFNGYTGDGGPALRACLGTFPDGMALDPRTGTVFIADRPYPLGYPAYVYDSLITRVKPPSSRLPGDQMIIPSRDGSQLFKFTETGRHLETWDAASGQKRLAFGYDPQGRLTRITDAFGRETTIERDNEGRPRRIVAPFGQTTELTLDAEGFLAGVTKPGGRHTALEYDPQHLLTRITGPRDDAYAFTYDAGGLLSGAQDPMGGGVALRGAPITQNGKTIGQAVVTTTTLGVRTVARLSQDPDTGQTVRAWTAADGSQTTVTETLDGVTHTIASDGTSMTMTLNPDPRLGMSVPIVGTRKVHAGGIDAITSQTRTIAWIDPTDEFGFSQLDRISVDGRVSQVRLTPTGDSGRRIETVTPLGRTTRLSVDPYGLPRISEPPGGLEATHFDYFDSGALKGMLQTTRRGSGSEERLVHYTYNSAGLLASLTDPLGRVTGFEYDAADRLTTEILPGGRHVGYEYDASGNLTALHPPGRPAYRYEFSRLNQPTTATLPAVGAVPGVTRYEYDLDKRPLRVTTPGGRQIRSVYDTAGRVTAVETPEKTLRNRYDGVSGNLAATGDGTTTYTYTYDQSLLRAVRAEGLATGTLTNTYGTGFRLAGTHLSDGQSTYSLAYQYDDDGEPTQVGPLGFTYGTGTGLLEGVSLAEGQAAVSTALTHNGFGELESLAVAHGGGTPLYEADLSARDKLGRLTSLTESVQGGPPRTQQFTYDIGGRLVAVLDDGGTTVATYAYDANGNRLSHGSAGGGTETAAYDDRDRLTAYGLATYAYNDDGQLTTRTLGTERTRYDYDTAGNLRGVTLAGGSRIDYLLGPGGERLGKQINGTTVQRFLYGAGQAPVAELDADGRIIARYVYGEHSHVPSAMWRWESEGGGSWVLYRIVTDARSSVRLVVRVSDGAVAQRIDYDEFGRVTTDTNPGFQPFGFAGGLYEPDTGLVRMGARDYDPQTGRFTTSDPAGFSGGLNLYGYVLNDPINGIDPSGLGPEYFPLIHNVLIVLSFIPALAPYTITLDILLYTVEYSMGRAGAGRDVALSVFAAAAPFAIPAKILRFEMHHPIPRVLGGNDRQVLTRLTSDIHHEFHNLLNRNIQNANFKPLTGRTGSKAIWRESLEDPQIRSQTLDIIYDTSLTIDSIYGTTIAQGVATNIAMHNYWP